MKHRNSHLLVGYWSRLRRNRDVPNQADIELRAIKRMAASTFVLDVGNPARPVYRRAGTALCGNLGGDYGLAGLFGSELRGTPFFARWDAQSTTVIAATLRRSLDLKQPTWLSSIGSTADCGMVELETILTPVNVEGNTPTRFFGLTQILSDHTPRTGKPIEFQRLIAARLVNGDTLEVLSLPSAARMATEISSVPPAHTIPSLRSHPRAPYLCLVASDCRPAPAA